MTSAMTGRRRLAILVLLFLGTACSSSPGPAEPPAPTGVVNLDEKGWEEVRARQRGRVLLVNFWATWCEPCREEFPAIVKLHQNYRAHGLSVVAISMDEPESVSAIEDFLKSQGARFGSYRHNFDDFAALINTINPRWGGAIPATFLYDRQGQLVSSWQGATKYAELESAVVPLLR
jgi:thiol-disulfide isomerase/thioredoxin